MSDDLVPPAMAGIDIPYRVVRTAIAGSAEESAALQGIEVSSLLRTIVVRRGEADYVFVLVPAGRRFDWPKLRAHLGVRQLSLPDADEARAATGYVDATILEHEIVAIGGGARGVNIHLAPADLARVLDAAVVDVSQPDEQRPG